MPIIGLNLGRGSVRAIEIENKKNGIVVNNFGLIENPKLNLETDTEYVSQAIQDFFDDVGFSTSDVILGLDEQHIFMRIIKMPVMSEREMKNAIKYEAEQYIPLPIDQVNISFKVLDPDLVDRDKVNVQVVAAKKDILDKYVSILRKAKLVPRAIEPETIALGRVLGDTKESPTGTMIIDIGFTSTLFVISYGGFVRFTRTIPLGGSVITKALAQELGLDIEQAEEYKKVYGMDSYQGDGKVSSVIKPLVDNLITECKRAQLFFTNHNPSASIKRIILTGGSALMPNLLPYIAKNSDIEVEMGNPFTNVDVSPKLHAHKDKLIAEAPRYSTALGLAMRSS